MLRLIFFRSSNRSQDRSSLGNGLFSAEQIVDMFDRFIGIGKSNVPPYRLYDGIETHSYFYALDDRSQLNEPKEN